MKIYEGSRARGPIVQVTDEPEIRELIDNGGARSFIGSDPTADSLLVGLFMALCLMKRLQLAGNRPVVLLCAAGPILSATPLAGRICAP